MSSDCRIPVNPDISGIGVRISTYAHTILSFIPAVLALVDGEVDKSELEMMKDLARANLILGSAMVIACFVQALTVGISSYHASIVLSMSWLNIIPSFVYFQLYLQYSWSNIVSSGPRRPGFFRVLISYFKLILIGELLIIPLKLWLD